MATPGGRLTSQVSTDAAPMTPRPSFGDSMNFPDMTLDAIAGRRMPDTNQAQQNQRPAMVQEGQSSDRHVKRSDLQLRSDKLTQPSLGDLEKELKNAREKIKDLSLSNDDDDDSSYSSMESFSISSNPSIGWEEELKRYEDQMPAIIKTDHFDALILYAENSEDQLAAEKFKNHLINEIDISPHGKVTAMLYDCPELTALSGSQINHLAQAVERSTYVFMYLTEHFVKDKWMEFSSESCLMTAIYDDDKRWCVVPVYTQRRAKCSFKIPMGLNSLKGINYYNNDEFYRRGVARLIADKVPQRKYKNEQLKMEKKKWVESYKRKQNELIAMQKMVEHAEEKKTAENMQFLKEETEKFIQNGMPGFHHSQSESQLNASYRSLQHTQSAESFKDIHSQNPNVAAFLRQFNIYNQQAQWTYPPDHPATTPPSMQTPYGQPNFYIPVQEQYADRYGNMHNSRSVQGDNAASTVHNQVVTFPLQTHQGIENIAIPKSLSDKIVSYSDEKQQEFVKLFQQENEKLNPMLHKPPDASLYQQIQTKEQLLQSTSRQTPGHFGFEPSISGQADKFTAETVHLSVQHHGGPLSNAPPLSTSHQDDVALNNMAQAQAMQGSPLTTHGHIGNQHYPVQGHYGNQGYMLPVQGLPPGNHSYYSTQGHRDDNGNQQNQDSMQDPQNQPRFSTLLSNYHSSSPCNSGGCNNSEEMEVNQQEGNLPHSGILEEDCGSLQSNTACATTTAGAPSADKGKSLQTTKEGKHMEDKEEEHKVTKGKKATSSKAEKNVYYTINVYNANAVQVGNQNMAQNSTGGEPNSGDASDDESESFPVNVVGTGMSEHELKEPSHTTQVLKKDPAEGDRDDQGTRAETEDQQQPTQVSCIMDAALSSAGSQAITNYQTEHPSHGTKQKTIDEEDNLEATPKYLKTTHQLPEGMEKLLFVESNLEICSSVEKLSLKNKVINEKVTPKESNKSEKNDGGELKMQDSKSTIPMVAIISPMRPKMRSESGEGTELKEVVQSDQTNVKTVVTESSESRASNFLGTTPQLLTKNAHDCDVEGYHSNVDNTVYSPGDSASANVSHEVPVTRDNRDVFSTRRITNARDLFYHARVGPVRSGIDALSSSSNQGGPSEGFTPAMEPFCEMTQGDPDIEYDMCDSDNNEGTVATHGGRPTSRARGKPKGLAANKQCAIS